MRALQASLGVALAVLNLGYWWLVVGRGQRGFHGWCERRFDVTITSSFRGHWRVTGGSSSWLRRFAIEWLQLVYFMGAFVVWAVAIVAAVVTLSLLD